MVVVLVEVLLRLLLRLLQLVLLLLLLLHLIVVSGWSPLMAGCVQRAGLQRLRLLLLLLLIQVAHVGVGHLIVVVINLVVVMVARIGRRGCSGGRTELMMMVHDAVMCESKPC